MASSEQVLERAWEILDRDGWCQHEAHSDDGRHCTLGAVGLASVELNGHGDYELIAAAGGLGLGHRSATQLLSAKIREEYPDGDAWGHIPGWNDDPERTYEDVALIFKKAIHDA